MDKPLYPDYPILIVDDEVHALISVSTVLKMEGYSNIKTVNDEREVADYLSKTPVSCVILDLMLPHIPGCELLDMIVSKHPEAPVIIATAHDEAAIAVECMKKGAYDFLVKPIETAHLLSSIRRAVEIRELRAEMSIRRPTAAKTRTDAARTVGDMVSRNRKMLEIFDYMEAVAPSSMSVFITGETGVGKELAAKAIHALSGRTGPLVPINVAGLDDTMFSDTLFGHIKGAYTGADSARSGLIAKAQDGTLFLDEIGDMTIPSQIKLLRLIQEREYLPLGSDMHKKTNARIIASTNRSSQELLASPEFRNDLYYRLKTHHIHLPPLRERRDDLPLLLGRFFAEASEELGKPQPAIPDQIIELLNAYHFPGNVRELRSLVFDAVGRHQKGMLSLASFRRRVANESGREPVKDATTRIQFGDQLPTLKEARQRLIDEAMKRANQNLSIAARMLGISRQSLSQQIKKPDE